MSDLIVVGFDDEADAFDMRAALLKLQPRFLIELDDSVVVTRGHDGKVRLHQTDDLAASGAVRGAFWGSLMGLLFLNPLVGIAVGASSGALSGKLIDLGIKDKFMKDLGATITPGTAALFVLVRKSTVDKVLAELAPFAGKGRVLQTSLTSEKEDALRKFIETREA